MLMKIFIDLMTKKIAGTLSPAEAQLLTNAVEKNVSYRKIHDALLGFSGKQYKPSNDHISLQLGRVWKQIDNGESTGDNPNSTRRSLKYLMRIAAALILGVLSVLLIMEYRKDRNITVETASRTRVVQLADGSRIRLDAHSALAYNKGYGKTARKMNFQGAAVFDIASDKAMPLYIDMNNIRIKVTGTLFLVNTREDQRTEVALLDGSIIVYNKLKKPDSVTLLPDQRLIISNDADDFTYRIDQVSTAIRTAAVFPDTLRFNNKKLEELVKDLSKKYNVRFEVNNQSLKAIRFSGVFVDEKLEEVLEALKISYPIKYTITGQNITIE